MIRPLLFSLVLGIFLTACSSRVFISPTSAITVEQAHEMSKRNVLLIDVREKNEVEVQAYDVENIKNLPLSQLESLLPEIPKNKQVILVCRTGNRSQKAFDLLQKNGFTNMTNMQGGMVEWEKKGLPVRKK